MPESLSEIVERVRRERPDLAEKLPRRYSVEDAGRYGAWYSKEPQERFGLSPQLVQILTNTAEWFGWLDKPDAGWELAR